jgi:subtilase family serine protease
MNHPSGPSDPYEGQKWVSATYTDSYAYQGTVYRPSSDTRIYKQNYSGTVSDHVATQYSQRYTGEVFSYNIQAVKIDVFDSNNVLVTGDLIQNLSYTIVTTYKNAGLDVLSGFSVAMSAEGLVKSTQAIATGLAVNTTGSVSFTYKPTTTGVKVLSSKVDSTNVIYEPNEYDNIVNLSRNVKKRNLRADSIEIVGIADNVAKNPLTQNYEYRAMVKYTNDGEVNITEDFNIDVYEDNIKMSTSARTTHTVAPGQQDTVYITFIAKTRGNIYFKAVIDGSSEVDESNETDNTIISTSKKDNKINVRVVDISFENSAGEVQNTFLIKGLIYKAKINLINDGDIDLSQFNIGIYDGATRIASLPVTGLNMSETTTQYVVSFSPTITGPRTFTVFADDNFELSESIETDNQITKELHVYDLQLVNYRITDIVNPPSDYTYPLDVTQMPVSIKSGYNVTFRIDVIGLAERVYSELSNSIGDDLGTVELTKISDTGTGFSTWEYTYTTDLETPNETIIYSVMKGDVSDFTYNFNIRNSWNGATLTINGSALDDAMIQRVY